MAETEPLIIDEDQEILDEEEVELDATEDDFFEYDETEPNLVETFMEHPKGKEALRKLSEQVHGDFDDAWDNSQEYRERVASDWNLFLGKLEKKTFPYDGCANPHVPIMFEVLTRVHARGMSELFGDWSNVFGVLPVNPDDRKTAEVISKHDNWQIRHIITDFRRQQHRGFLLFLCQGDVVAHSYYDMSRMRNCHDILTCDEFVIPYVYTSTEPDFSDVPFKVKIMQLYRHELQAMGDEAGWYGVDRVLDREAPSFLDEPEQAWRQAISEIEGIQEPEEGGVGAYKLLHYEGWTEHMPEQERDRFVRIVMDADTKAVMHLSIHEEENWQDRLRFEQQMAEREAYMQAKQQYEAAMAELERQKAFLQDELTDPLLQGPYRGEREREAAALSAEPPPPPPPPEWMDEAAMLEGGEPPEPDPPRMEPIHMFSHGVCVEPVVGNLGVGYGRMLSDMNKAANVALAQYTDAATFGNSKVLITAGGMQFKRPFEVAPGVVNEALGVSGQDLKQNFHELSLGHANPQLVDIVNMMTESARTSVQAPEVLSGEPGKSGETYRGISARIEQATKQLSVTTRKYADFLEQILKNNAKLNAIYLPEEQIVEIYDEQKAAAEGLEISRSMWERDYRVEIRADLRFATQAQRVQEADELIQMGQHPVLMQNFEFQKRALVKALEARGEAEMAQLVKDMPNPAPPPGAGGPPGGPPGPGGGAPAGMGPPSPGEPVPAGGPPQG